ncbi:hypothetical protein sce5018 [Sorangium cellulosum So ce56]|uniref:AAA+ ATPase domain-containing protein n=1 Tax=Sorangium cellulosum (strain So ce56) TaxID=448385 RepID=A9FL57_SORC5|nr:ATP-binding protein [Sorangium cellulosum]CAN95181.1 hypothetical protein sce5018 [Sorangium cellulosum So ce56]
MITSVHLHDFKGHRDSTVPLGQFTVLVGPNGSGKTSVLEALWAQGQVPNCRPSQFFVEKWSIGDLVRRGAQGPSVLISHGISNALPWSSWLELNSSSPVAFRWIQGKSDNQYQLTDSQTLSVSVPQIAQGIGQVSMYEFDAEIIGAAAYSDQPGPDVERDGTNTAVALTAIKLGYDEDFARIEDSLRRIIPNVERVRIRQAIVRRPKQTFPGESERVVGSKIFFDFRGAPGVPAHAASEGTLITLALLTVLHGPNRPSVLLLDDFAESLHPQAQMELVRLIKRLLEEFKDLQIVATTHSPYILDELDPAQVIAFALRKDGTVALKRLSEHPQAEQMKGALSTGQLWSLDPERAWVSAEGDP